MATAVQGSSRTVRTSVRRHRRDGARLARGSSRRRRRSRRRATPRAAAEKIERADAPDRGPGHQVRLLPAGLDHRPRDGQGRRVLVLPPGGRARATSSSTARPPTCSPIATATTSASGPRSQSSPRSPISTPSRCCPGIPASRACTATATTPRPASCSTPTRARTSRRIAHEFEQELGYQFLIGIEPEMMWLRKPRPGEMPEGVTKPYCYHIHQFEELRPVLLDVVEYGQALGPRHELRRPRGRSGPAGAELPLRPAGPDGGQHHHLPAGVRRGRRASTTCWRASCPSRSPACRPTAITITSR